MSAMVSYGNRGVPKLQTALQKRYDKAWCSVNELVESENRYVQKLALLDKVSFYKKITQGVRKFLSV